jgi:tryptophan synthase alpha chain
MSRIEKRFAQLKQQGRAGLITFVTAGDPDRATSQAILDGLPAAGADLIELGVPFSDPMADGPVIELASQRALKNGATLARTLEMVAEFRQKDAQTPVILMGYYNPVYAYGAGRFCADAAKAGVDGLIIVDLPPEEAAELGAPARASGIDVIYLTTPTSDDARLPTVLASASGFVYHVSIAGITGTASAQLDAVSAALARIRRHTGLPLAVGFGIKTAAQVAEIGKLADAAVVGSAIVQKLADQLDENGKPREGAAQSVLGFVKELAAGLTAAQTLLE